MKKGGGKEISQLGRDHFNPSRFHNYYNNNNNSSDTLFLGGTGNIAT